MQNFLAITTVIIAITIVLVLFYYALIYLKLKPALRFIDTIGMTQEEMMKSKPQRLIDTHQKKVIRTKPPAIPFDQMIRIIDGIMKVEFEFKALEYSMHDYFIYDDLNELVKKMSADIYADIGVSLIHDFEYYYDKDFLIKYISRATREFIAELMEKKKELERRL